MLAQRGGGNDSGDENEEDEDEESGSLEYSGQKYAVEKSAPSSQFNKCEIHGAYSTSTKYMDDKVVSKHSYAHTHTHARMRRHSHSNPHT